MRINSQRGFTSAGKTIYGKVSYLITKMSKTDLTGSQKMASVVAELYSYVPQIFKRYFNSEKLQEIVQSAYDSMKEFAEKEIEEIKAKK